jgi:hypothetical protein
MTVSSSCSLHPWTTSHSATGTQCLLHCPCIEGQWQPLPCVRSFKRHLLAACVQRRDEKQRWCCRVTGRSGDSMKFGPAKHGHPLCKQFFPWSEAGRQAPAFSVAIQDEKQFVQSRAKARLKVSRRQSWQSKVRQSETKQDEVRQSQTKPKREVRQSQTKSDKVRQSQTKSDKVRQSQRKSDKVRQSQTKQG